MRIRAVLPISNATDDGSGSLVYQSDFIGTDAEICGWSDGGRGGVGACRMSAGEGDRSLGRRRYTEHLRCDRRKPRHELRVRDRDFTGWKQTHATSGSSFGATNNTLAVNSRTFGAFFTANMPPLDDMISQSIPTIAGDAYRVSFFLADVSGRPNQFTANVWEHYFVVLDRFGVFRLH